MSLILSLNKTLKQRCFAIFMRLIKLDAIGSTNDFLKQMMAGEYVPDFTVISAETQTNGRGQRGAVWFAEPGKNLTFSVLMPDLNIAANKLFQLNLLVAVALFRALQKYNLPDVSIKWPNDILSGKLKVAGILIENVIRSAQSVKSIAGIGLNVNQKDFGELPQASSMASVLGTSLDKWEVLEKLIYELEMTVAEWKINPQLVISDYESNLFRLNKPTAFETPGKNQFMGIVKGVSALGLLQIQMEDDSLELFDLKELKMLY